MHPVNKVLLSTFDACSDSLLLDVSAFKLERTACGLISDSPVFLFRTGFWLSRVFLFLTCLKFYCVTFSQHFFFSILARQSSVCGPNSNAAGDILSNVRTCPECSGVCTIFSLVCHWPTHPSVGSLVAAAYSWLSHSTGCQHTSSRIASPKRYRREDVSHNASSLLLLASAREFPRCGQACRQRLLASISHSICTILRKVSSQADLSEWHNFTSVSPCLEDYDMAFSWIISLENCSRPKQCAEPSNSSAHVQVQFLVLYFNRTASRNARSCP